MRVQKAASNAPFHGWKHSGRGGILSLPSCQKRKGGFCGERERGKGKRPVDHILKYPFSSRSVGLTTFPIGERASSSPPPSHIGSERRHFLRSGEVNHPSLPPCECSMRKERASRKIGSIYRRMRGVFPCGGRRFARQWDRSTSWVRMKGSEKEEEKASHANVLLRVIGGRTKGAFDRAKRGNFPLQTCEKERRVPS